MVLSCLLFLSLLFPQILKTMLHATEPQATTVAKRESFMSHQATAQDLRLDGQVSTSFAQPTCTAQHSIAHEHAHHLPLHRLAQPPGTSCSTELTSRLHRVNTTQLHFTAHHASARHHVSPRSMRLPTQGLTLICLKHCVL